MKSKAANPGSAGVPAGTRHEPTRTSALPAPALVPKLRFPEFRNAEGWNQRPLSEFMSESRLPGSKGNVAKKITVKLWGNGVFEKNDAIQGSINTQYFRRKAGQFIYSKLDFLNQAFGIIPPSLDGFESTVDLPCFDFADGLNSVFLLEYVKRRDFYERLGETADGSRKARRIHAETFLSFPIALPSPAEQQKNAACLSSVDELIAAQARKLDALKTHKKGLMQQLFPREGETQPRLRFPEFQNAGEWEEDQLGSVCELYQPVTLSSSELSMTGEFLVYGANGIIGSHNEYNHEESEIAVTCRGATCGEVTITKPKSWVTGNAMIVKPRTKVLRKDFIFHYFKNHGLKAIISGSAQPQITRTGFAPLMVFFPKPAEQQRIADCLTILDDLITAQTQKIEALKTHKKGLMQQLFPSPEEVAG